ncbi:MAG: hypothetical protein KC912_08825 [Proteobacteria bacterium]|nr:hypothetical protein [Pseudomonadota bacterium]
MHRALAPLLLLALAGCETEDAQDRITIELADGEPNVRMDLEPITLTDVDNNVDITVTFDAPDTESADSNSVLLLQYRVLYGVGDIACDSEGSDCTYIAGDIYSELSEGGTESLSLRGAVEAQLDWAQAHYTSDELDVSARVQLQGYYGTSERLDSYHQALIAEPPDQDEIDKHLSYLERVDAGYDFIATFADYR